MAAVRLAKGACTLWEEELLLDYTIEVEDEQFKVHKVVMASASDYFKVMLTGSLVESQSDRVRLHEVSSLVVSTMIDYIYTGQLDTTKVTTEELLACAVYLQMPAAIEECTNLLVQDVVNLNCFDILATFKTYFVADGVDTVTQYIKSNLDDLMNVSPPAMSFNGFQCFMEFWQKSEWELFLCVLKWVDAHGSHALYLNDLLSRVRFALMTPEQLEAIKQIEVYTKSNGAWRDLITAAEAFHDLPIHHKVLDDSEQSRPRSDPVPICYIADDESSSVFYSLHNGKSWKKREARLAPSLYEGVEAHVTVNNYLIVCDSHYSVHDSEPLFQKWHVFDPRTMTWSTMRPMNVARDAFGLVQHKNHLYALGGCTDVDAESAVLTDVIERYDFETNAWEVISTKLPVPLESHGACVIGDSIHVAGGYKSPKQRFTKRHYRLNLSTNTWESRAPMPIEKVKRTVDVIQVMRLWGEEVLFVFDRTYAMHYYSPSTDQWSKWDCFSHVQSELVHEFCPVVLPAENTLFLHTFAYSMKPNNDTSSVKPSYNGKYRRRADPGECIGCVKWTVGHNGEKIIEVKLDDFPIDVQEYEGTFFTALLSIPPQHLRRPRKISVERRSPKESLTAPDAIIAFGSLIGSGQ